MTIKKGKYYRDPRPVRMEHDPITWRGWLFIGGLLLAVVVILVIDYLF